MVNKRQQSKIARFVLRMPEDLRKQLKIKAKRAGRSMNTQAVRILSDGLHNDAA